MDEAWNLHAAQAVSVLDRKVWNKTGHGTSRTSFFSLECATAFTAFKWVECVQVRQGMGHGNRTSTVRMRPGTRRQGVAVAAWWDKFGWTTCNRIRKHAADPDRLCICVIRRYTSIHHGDAYGPSHAMEKADVYTVVLSIYIYILYPPLNFLYVLRGLGLRLRLTKIVDLYKKWGWFPRHCRHIVVCKDHVGCTSFL